MNKKQRSDIELFEYKLIYDDIFSINYSTLDICRIFGFVMESVQQYIKSGFFRPAFLKKHNHIQKYMFVRSQLVWIGIFRGLLKIGVCRKLCKECADSCYNIISLSGKHDSYDIFVIELNDGKLQKTSGYFKNYKINLNSEGNDILVVKIHHVLNSIMEYSK